MLKIKYKDNIINPYYKKIVVYLNGEKVLSGKLKGSNFINFYNDTLKGQLGNIELQDILLGDFPKLIEIKNKLDKIKINTSKTEYEKLDNSIKELFNYDGTSQKKTKKRKFAFNPLTGKQDDIKSFFENSIKPVTCYFCNIDYINVFDIDKGTCKSGFTLDHFIPKNEYPLLALSLFNLIPSCYTCNTKVKGKQLPWEDEKDISKTSPSSVEFEFEERVKFKTFFSNNNLNIKDEAGFDVLLKEDFTSVYKKYINVFHLDERYSYHKYHVLEMIEKRRIYPDSRIEELAKITKQTTEKVKQDLFGTLLYDDDLSKRSLSKFTQDIARELGLV